MLLHLHLPVDESAVRWMVELHVLHLAALMQVEQV